MHGASHLRLVNRVQTRLADQHLCKACYTTYMTTAGRMTHHSTAHCMSAYLRGKICEDLWLGQMAYDKESLSLINRKCRPL